MTRYKTASAAIKKTLEIMGKCSNRSNPMAVPRTWKAAGNATRSVFTSLVPGTRFREQKASKSGDPWRRAHHSHVLCHNGQLAKKPEEDGGGSWVLFSAHLASTATAQPPLRR